MLLTLAFTLGAPMPALAQERRVALVVGNGAYQHTQNLPNPRNDAAAMAVTLGRLGFQVFSGLDLNYRNMGRLVSQFADAVARADVALLYYAGHGVQIAGRNVLIPIDAEPQTESDLTFQAINLDTILGQMGNASGINIVFLDACRDNPFAKQRQSGWPAQRSGDVPRGLARLDLRRDAFIAFATDPDAAASDGEGQNSPFTSALLRYIETPSVDVEIMMKSVKEDVQSSTGGKQRPWTSSSLARSFMFAPSGTAAAPAPVALPAARPPQKSGGAASTTRCDDLFLDAKQQRDRIRALSEFRQSCPAHASVAEAARLLEQAVDSRNCDRALSERTIAALQDYLDVHPEGRCKTEVVAELNRKRQEQRRMTEGERAEEERVRRQRDEVEREAELRRKENELRDAEQRQRREALDRRERELAERQAALQRQEQPAQRSLGASEPAPPAAAPASGPTLWNHNGSIVLLVANGSSRRIYYQDPRQGMRDEGVANGTLLFEGTKTGDTYTGTAYVFSRQCGTLPYAVSGTIASDQRSFVMRGMAPRLSTRCKVLGTRSDELVFMLQ